jgi:DNA recombination protein RmuC
MAGSALFAGAGGLALGALIIWLVCRSQTARLGTQLEAKALEAAGLKDQAAAAGEFRVEASRLQAELDAERRLAPEKLAVLKDAEARFREAFTALSADALKANNQQFLQLADTHLSKFQESAESNLEAREKAIADLVKPIEDGLKRVDERIGTVEKERVDAYADLRRHVEEMGKGQQQLQSETQNLVKALRAPQVRGA